MNDILIFYMPFVVLIVSIAVAFFVSTRTTWIDDEDDFN